MKQKARKQALALIMAFAMIITSLQMAPMTASANEASTNVEIGGVVLTL